MKRNQIKIKKIQNGTITLMTIKNGMVYDAFGKNHVYCGCTGNTPKTATPMEYADGEVFCPHCHEKKVEVLQTYDEWKAEQDEKDRKRNEERLANLHLVEAGSDWECGFKYYALSAEIQYGDWLKVKQHFRYYRRGWSRGQELEWNYGEPSGWLTRNPQAVEEILVKEGLIKPENTMAAIEEKAAAEREKREAERKETMEKREQIKEEIDAVDKNIREAFESEDRRVLSDAEASHYCRGDYGTGTVCRYTVTDTEIVKYVNMGDFVTGIAIPYSEDVEIMLIRIQSLNEEFWKCMRS